MNLERVKSLLPKVIKHRRELHKIPEVGLDLPKTKSYVKGALEELGCEVREVGHGLVCDIGKPPYIGVRADMDALPVEEQNDVPYKSTHKGMMHACGHDAHTAVLLGLAEYLMENFPPMGVRLIFQPGEEGFFGAVDMIENGVLEDVKVIIGEHVGSIMQAPEGAIVTKKGVFLAAADTFHVTFKGKGGHGSAPHEAVDPIVPASQFVLGVYSFRGREVLQTRPFVSTVTKFQSGTTFNVIPDKAQLSGTVRSVDENDRKLAEKRLRELAENIGRAYGVEVEFEYEWGYRTTVNTDWAVEMVGRIAKEIGVPFVELDTPIMGAEDFSYYLEKVPGVFFFVNTSNAAKGIVHPNHSPLFDVDEDKLWIPLAVFVRFIEEYSAAKS